MTPWHTTFQDLDRISRQRALTDRESILMETCIKAIDGPQDRVPDRSTAWPVADEDTLLRLHADGLGTAQIARTMRRTENSVKGKLLRMQGRKVG